MSCETEVNFDEIIKTIADNEGIANYTTEVKPGSFKGDNYLGIITAITIKGVDKKGNKLFYYDGVCILFQKIITKHTITILI